MGQLPDIKVIDSSLDTLQSEHLLLAEFKYITEVAFQVTEDGAKVSTFYLTTLGTMLVAVVGAQLRGTGDTDSSVLIYRAFALLFVLQTLNGLYTVLHIVKLRQAWGECVEAMNKIKQIYLECYPEISPVITWKRGDTDFKYYKKWSISSLLVLKVATLAAVSGGLATGFYLKAGDRAAGKLHTWNWDASLAAAVCVFGVLLVVYRLALSKRGREFLH